MRPWIIILTLLLVADTRAQQVRVTGTITYLSVGTVYTSIGWAAGGIEDSMPLFVVAGIDTVARLRVFAMSSKSCACTIVSSTGELKVGDRVVGMVNARAPKVDGVSVAARDTVAPDDRTVGGVRFIPSRLAANESEPSSFLTLRGRASLQYYTARFTNDLLNFSQPGMILNLSAVARDIPVRIDLYGNIRTMGRGGISPFSTNATNDSRIYRLSVEYDDRANDVIVGRIIPTYSPSIGSIDGVSYARRFGELTTGISFGFQPSYDLQGLSTDYRKAAFFAQYRMHSDVDLTLTGAYARTYYQSALDREAVSFALNLFTAGSLSVYGYGDFDLRAKRAEQFPYSPSISMGTLMVNYRVMDFLSVGLGFDASRPVFPFSTVRMIADSLLDRTLHSGATFTVNVNLMNGIGMFNTFSPRQSENGFGQEYSNYSSFYVSNVLSSGATLRATYSMNENAFTSGRGYGVNLQRTIGWFDVNIRYQQNRYRLLQIGQQNTGETLGGDLMALISRNLSFVTSIDKTSGYGMNSYTVFSELSWRF